MQTLMNARFFLFKGLALLILGIVLSGECLSNSAFAQNIALDLTVEEALRLYWQSRGIWSNATRGDAKQPKLSEQTLQQISQLKLAYYSALYAQYLVDIAQRNLSMLNAWLGIVSARNEVGATPGRDPTALQQELAQVHYEFRQAQLMRQRAIAELRYAVGLPTDFLLNVIGTFQNPDIIPDLKTLADSAMIHHPELKSDRLKNASPTARNEWQWRLAVQVKSAWAKVAALPRQADRLQLTELPRVVDAQSVDDTLHDERLGTLLPLLEAMRTRRAVRAAWLRSRFTYQSHLIELEAAVGKQIF